MEGCRLYSGQVAVPCPSAAGMELLPRLMCGLSVVVVSSVFAAVLMAFDLSHWLAASHHDRRFKGGAWHNATTPHLRGLARGAAIAINVGAGFEGSVVEPNAFVGGDGERAWSGGTSDKMEAATLHATPGGTAQLSALSAQALATLAARTAPAAPAAQWLGWERYEVLDRNDPDFGAECVAAWHAACSSTV